MHSVCDGKCRQYKRISKIVRYENSDQVKYICGPCNENHQNYIRKQHSFRPSKTRRA